MAQENILLSLQLDVDQTTSNLKKVLSATEQLKNEQKQLADQLKSMKQAGQEGTASFDALQTKMVENKIAIQLLSKEQQNYEKQLRLSATANRAEEGSLDQLKAKLSTLTAQWNAMEGSLRTNSTEGQKLQTEIAGITEQLNAQEQSVGNYRRQVGNYEVGVKSLRTQLKEATNAAFLMAQQFGEDSKQAVIAQQKLADLKKEQQDLNERVAAFNPEAKFKAFTQTAAGLAGGIGAVSGAMGLLGGESEDAAQALLKVQQFMQFTQGLNQLSELADGIKSLRVLLFGATAAKQANTVAQVENTAATVAGTVATAEQTVATEGATVATAGLNKTLLANPIGIIVVGILAAVAAFKLFESIVDDTAERFEQADANSNRLLESVKNQAQIGAKSLDTFKTETEQRVSLMKAQGKGEGEIFTARLARFNQEKQLGEDTIAQNKENQSQLRNDINKNRSLLNDDLDKDQKEKIQKDIDSAQAEIDLLDQTNQTILDRTKQSKAALEIAAIEADEKRQVTHEKALQVRISLIKDEQQREIASVRETASEQIRQLSKAEAENGELIKAIRAKERADIEEINKQADRRRLQQVRETGDLELEAQKAIINQRVNQELAAARGDEQATLAARIDQINSNFQVEVQELDNQKAKRIDIIRQEIEDKKITVQLGEQQIAEIEATVDAEKLDKFQAASDDYVQVVKDTNIKILQEQLNFKQLQAEAADPSEALAVRLEAVAVQQAIDEQNAKDTIKNEVELQEALLLIKKKYAGITQALTESEGDRKLKQAADILGAMAGLQKQGGEAYKIFASAEAIINTYAAATAALAPPPLGLGPVSGIPVAVAAVLNGLANVGRINGVQFKEGGYTGDGNPNEVSTAIGAKPYTYHKSEYVIPANVLSMPEVAGYVSSTIEPMRRGRYPVSSSHGYASGGFVDLASVGRGVDTDYIQSIVEATARAVVSGMPNPVVFVEDINTGQGRVSKVEQRANI